MEKDGIIYDSVRESLINSMSRNISLEMEGKNMASLSQRDWEAFNRLIEAEDEAELSKLKKEIQIYI